MKVPSERDSASGRKDSVPRMLVHRKATELEKICGSLASCSLKGINQSR